jgi:hypothetical protein
MGYEHRNPLAGLGVAPLTRERRPAIITTTPTKPTRQTTPRPVRQTTPTKPIRQPEPRPTRSTNPFLWTRPEQRPSIKSTITTAPSPATPKPTSVSLSPFAAALRPLTPGQRARLLLNESAPVTTSAKTATTAAIVTAQASPAAVEMISQPAITVPGVTAAQVQTVPGSDQTNITPTETTPTQATAGGSNILIIAAIGLGAYLLWPLISGKPHQYISRKRG